MVTHGGRQVELNMGLVVPLTRLARLSQYPRCVDWLRSVATSVRLLVSEPHCGPPAGGRSGPASSVDLDTVGSVDLAGVQVGLVTSGHSVVAVGVGREVEVDRPGVHDVLALHLHLLSLSLRRVVRLSHPLLVSVCTVAFQHASLALPGLLCGLDHLCPPELKEIVGVRVELQSVLPVLQSEVRKLSTELYVVCGHLSVWVQFV